MNEQLKIGFLLGSPDINGGTYVIYEHSSRLLTMGHEVSIITQEKVSPERYDWHPGASTLTWMTMEEAETREFDIILATWWKSPYLMHGLKAKHFVYFVQSIETRFFEKDDPTNLARRDHRIWQDHCESTYAMNIPVITEATWIRDYLFDNYNRDAFLVRNGIRKDIYTEAGQCIAPRSHGRLRVLVEGPVDVHYKNVPKSIALCREAGVDEIWLLTSSPVDTFPDVDRIFSRVPIHETPEIYRSCDVLVKLSYVEGMFGPPLEMFHCGGTAIVYDVTGHDEYIVHDENSYVVKKDQDEDIVNLLRRLKDNPEELQRLQSGGGRTADNWPDWDNSAELFEAALKEINNGSQTSRSYLKKYTDRQEKVIEEQLVLKEADRFKTREQLTEPELVERGNFFRVYFFSEADDINPKDSRWLYYREGEPQVLTLSVPITGFPFWIRVDPSLRIGVFMIDSIQIFNTRLNEVVYTCNRPEHFDTLYAGGSLRRIRHREKGVYVSCGSVPWLILPAVESGDVGDELEVTISLKEEAISEYMNYLSDREAEQIPPPRQSLLRRLIQKTKIRNLLR